MQEHLQSLAEFSDGSEVGSVRVFLRREEPGASAAAAAARRLHTHRARALSIPTSL
jgi:hypothetical protein